MFPLLPLCLFFPPLPFPGDVVQSGGRLARTQGWGLPRGAEGLEGGEGFLCWEGVGHVPQTAFIRKQCLKLQAPETSALLVEAGARQGGGRRLQGRVGFLPSLTLSEGVQIQSGEPERDFPRHCLIFVPTREEGPARPGDSLRTAWAVAELGLESPNFRCCALCSTWSHKLAPSVPSIRLGPL